MDISDFKNLPADSRVWVYFADRQLTDREVIWLDAESDKFTEQWTVHGHDMQAKAGVLHQYFWVLAANEAFNAASGCGIDKSVHFVQNVGQQLGLDFFNRLQIPMVSDNKIKIEKMSTLKTGVYTSANFTYDLTVSRLSDLQNSWVKPLGETWLKKHMQPFLV
ncbi:MAG: hypothetical protein SGJ10_13320 [Bacteroidota bacterium]|nr:hypothetical protein [Bacteroidota bacterium]